MKNHIKLAIGLTLAASSLSAQSGPIQAPVPGPYMIVIAPQRVTPQQFAPQKFAPQKFTMPMPYWMQNNQAQRQQPARAQAPTPPAVGRATQQPSSTGWQPAPNAQGNGAGPTPGFFPTYNSGQQPQAARSQPPAPTYGAPYPGNGFTPMPWGNQAGNQAGNQGFMPMSAPWQYGQNSWGNNWNNNSNSYGYGYPQGYAPSNSARQ
ncbi:hypothetical protein [Profundibacter sp.]